MGNGVRQGVESFASSGHLAMLALTASAFYPGKMEKTFCVLSALTLIGMQLRSVYLVHEQFKKECVELGVNIEDLFNRPYDQSDIKLPRYLSQNLTGLLKMLMTTALSYDEKERHFKNEIKGSDNYGNYRSNRFENQNLLNDSFADLIGHYRNRHPEHGVSGNNSRWLMHMLCPFMKFLTISVGFVGHFAHFLYLLPDALRTKQPPKIGLDWSKNLMFFPISKFIPEDVFEQLSDDLQYKIEKLNDQELFLHAYNIFGGSDYSCNLFQYSQYDSDLNMNGYGYSYRYNALNQYRKHLKEWAIGVAADDNNCGMTVDQINRLTDKQLFDLCGNNGLKPWFAHLFTTEVELMIALQKTTAELDGLDWGDPQVKPLNLMERGLQLFIPFNAEYDELTRRKAKSIAQQVLAHIPKSYLANKVLALTSDLEPIA